MKRRGWADVHLPAARVAKFGAVTQLEGQFNVARWDRAGHHREKATAALGERGLQLAAPCRDTDSSHTRTDGAEHDRRADGQADPLFFFVADREEEGPVTEMAALAAVGVRVAIRRSHTHARVATGRGGVRVFEVGDPGAAAGGIRREQAPVSPEEVSHRAVAVLRGNVDVLACEAAGQDGEGDAPAGGCSPGRRPRGRMLARCRHRLNA